MKELQVEDEGDALWSALAHRTRRRILDLLAVGPANTTQIVAGVGLPRHTVMAHLSVLRDADLVIVEQQGRQRINHLNDVPIQSIHRRWVQPTNAPWAAALIEVRDHAEKAARTIQADCPQPDLHPQEPTRGEEVG